MKEEEPHEHTPEAIRARLQKGPDISYLREWVYGGIDGTVTTFAVVAGVTGADLAPVVVVVLGLANLIGDGFSMAAGAYTGMRTEIDNYDRLRALEERQIDRAPEGEREEVRQIYAARGFAGDDLARAVGVVTADRKIWVDTMLEGEYGLTAVQKTPFRAGLHTFLAFVACGCLPLLPFVFGVANSFSAAVLLSALTFFGIGSFKSRWAVQGWLRQGLQTLAVGMMAAGLAYLIGFALRDLAG